MDNPLYCSCKYSPIYECYLPFTEEVIVGFTVDAFVGSTLVSAVEVGAVVTCGGFADCDVEYNAADVDDAAMDDPTFIVRVVA